MFLYDITSSYLEGEQNELGEFGYNRDGKKGKLQIVLGLLTDAQGEPLAVRVFAGNTADPATVVDQIKILQEQFQVREFVFVGDRGMVKSKGVKALQEANLRLHHGADRPADSPSTEPEGFAAGLVQRADLRGRSWRGALRAAKERERGRTGVAPLGG